MNKVTSPSVASPPGGGGTTAISFSYLSASDKTADFFLVTTADTVGTTAQAALSDFGITLQADSLSFEAPVVDTIPRTTFNLELSSLNFSEGGITTTEGERDTRQKLLFYSVDNDGEVSALSFDPLVNAGARFYDLDGDGIADYLSLTLVDGGFGDKDGEKNGVMLIHPLQPPRHWIPSSKPTTAPSICSPLPTPTTTHLPRSTSTPPSPGAVRL